MSDEISDEDSFHNVYRLFHHNLKKLESERVLHNLEVRELQSELLDDGFGVLQHSKSALDAEQRALIEKLLTDLERIPKSVFSEDKSEEASHRDILHPCWVPLRQQAARIVKALETVTKRTDHYFSS